ncbi:TPA: hypothetical protein ACMDOB_000526 [Vibrio metschnikovii]
MKIQLISKIFSLLKRPRKNNLPQAYGQAVYEKTLKQQIYLRCPEMKHDPLDAARSKETVVDRDET